MYSSSRTQRYFKEAISDSFAVLLFINSELVHRGFDIVPGIKNLIINHNCENYSELCHSLGCVEQN